MITENGKYFLYRHIRLDTNQVFYVGIGTKLKSKWRFYERAHKTKDRNHIWYKITSKTAYIVEIILESGDRDFIQKKEIEFIDLYGRIDKGTGTLANLTDGGDNGLNRSACAIEKQLETAKKNGTYQAMIDRMKHYATKKGQIGSNCQRVTFLYNKDGIYVNKFISRKECGKFIGISGEAVAMMIRLRKIHHDYIAVNSFLGETINSSNFLKKRDKNKAVIKICPISFSIVEKFNKGIEAAKSIKCDKERISYSALNNKLYKGYYWSYKNTVEEFLTELNNKKVCQLQ